MCFFFLFSANLLFSNLSAKKDTDFLFVIFSASPLAGIHGSSPHFVFPKALNLIRWVRLKESNWVKDHPVSLMAEGGFEPPESPQCESCCYNPNVCVDLLGASLTIIPRDPMIMRVIFKVCLSR